MAFNFQSIKACTNCVMALVMFIVAINFYFNERQTEISFVVGEEVTRPIPHEIKRDFKKVLEFLPHNIISELTYDTAKQLQCMALNNYYEAATEGVDGMLAVSQVVVNRVGERGFPSTACDVVYQKTKSTCQFSWHCQKTLPKLDTDSNAWRNAVYAATHIYIDGNSVSGLDDALFYHADYVRPNWKRLVKVKKIGTHIFYKKVETIS
jgi:hypothetical protein